MFFICARKVCLLDFFVFHFFVWSIVIAYLRPFSCVFVFSCSLLSVLGSEFLLIIIERFIRHSELIAEISESSSSADEVLSNCTIILFLFFCLTFCTELGRIDNCTVIYFLLFVSSFILSLFFECLLISF